jgi:hypothetical protein
LLQWGASRKAGALFVVDGRRDMANLKTVELKPFVPAKDFELSKRFYQDFGFTMKWS